MPDSEDDLNTKLAVQTLRAAAAESMLLSLQQEHLRAQKKLSVIKVLAEVGQNYVGIEKHGAAHTVLADILKEINDN
jgi:hypothetical protein